MGADSQTDAKLRVFISYSRSDLPFAERLLEALGAAGFEAYIDRTDIAPGEPWRERIGSLITQADTVIFVISPASIASPICTWEVDEAERLAKRILPVLWRRVPDEAVPERLRRLNYTNLTEADDFIAGMRRLSDALFVDAEWIRDHTRFGELARRWRLRDRIEAAALRGAELDEAENWIARRPAKAPEVSEEQREFIRESRAAEQMRSRLERERITRMRRLQRRFGVALVAAALILTAGGTATIVQSRKAAESRILALAQRAREAFQAEYYDRALRYAVAAMPPPGSFPWDRPAEAVAIAEVELARAALRSRLVEEKAGSTGGDGEGVVAQPVEALLQEVDARDTPAASDPAVAALLAKVAPPRNNVWRITVDKGKTRLLVLRLEANSPGQWEMVACEQLSTIGSDCEQTPDQGTLDLYDVASGEAIPLPRIGDVGIVDATISPRGDGIAFASESRIFFRPLGGANDQDIVILDGTVAKQGKLVFSMSGNLLAASLQDGSVWIWNTDFRKPLARLVGHRATVDRLGFFRDTGIVTLDAAHVARYWTLEDLLQWRYADSGPTTTWLPEAGGRKLKVVGSRVSVVDAATGQELLSEDLGAEPLASGFVDAGRTVASRMQMVEWRVVNEDPDCVIACTEPVLYEQDRIMPLPDAARLHAEALVRSVCSGKLNGVESFTEDERQDPLLVGLAGSVCEGRQGPLSPAFYMHWLNARM